MSYRRFLFCAIAGLFILVTPAFGGVTIISPSNGKRVSGVVKIRAQVDHAWWSRVLIDGADGPASGRGNVVFRWNSEKVADGQHTLTVQGYRYEKTRANAADSITVTVDNHSSASSTIHFGTLPNGASLHGDTWCANHIPWEREMVPANAGVNDTMPSAGQLAAFAADGYVPSPYGGEWAYARVNGQYTGTTDMIFRWAACKWGIDEDVVRAQATVEQRNWNQYDSGGDERWSYSECANGGLSLWSYMCPNCCYQSWSIWQTKVYYDWPTWPMIHNSTAFAADFRYADQRACMDGDLMGYFNGRPRHDGHTYAGDIASGDLSTILWGCIGMHYSGDWFDRSAIGYINRVKDAYANKPWKSRWPKVNWPD